MRFHALPTVVLASVVGLAAQQVPQGPTFRASVDLVQIDVVAVDQDGHPVRGLTAADFTLLDRKKPQRIVTFEEVNRASATEAAGRPAARPPVKMDVATNQTPPDDRLVVLVLDDLHLFRGRTDRAKQIARKVVDSLGPDASTAVLFTSGRHSLEFTRDRDEVLAAVDTLVGASAARRPTPGVEDFPPEGKSPSDPVGSPKDSGTIARPALSAAAITPPIDAHGLQHFIEDLTTYKTIEDAARMLIGTDSRRKAFVLVSEGTGNNLTGLFQSRNTPCEIRSPASPCFHQRALVQDMATMQKANIALYIFDPRGAVPNEDIALECSPGTSGLGMDPCVGRTVTSPNNWIRNDQRGLEITAAASGGFAVTNTDDFDGGVARLVEQMDHYYLLGFSPTDPKGGGFRPVTVTTDRPGVTLRFRQGYEIDDAAPKPATKDPLIGLASGLVPRTDLPLRMMAAPLAPAPGTPPGKPTTRVVAILEATVQRSEIVGRGQDRPRELRYAVLAASLADGKVIQDVSNTASISSAGDSAPKSPAGTVVVEIPVELTLPPGRYQLRASAISEALARGGSVYLNLEVPDFRLAPLAMGGPILGSVEADRVPIAHGPSAKSALPFTPSLDRTFARAETLRVYCPLTRADANRSLQATIELIDASDGVAFASSHPLSREDGSIDVSLPLAALVPGPYRLRIRVTDGGGATAEREVGIVVM